MATKLIRATEKGGVIIPATSVTREVGGFLVTLTVEGLVIREKGRRLAVGPFNYGALYQEGIQRQSGLASLKPRKVTKKVSRGLLTTGQGK